MRFLFPMIYLASVAIYVVVDFEAEGNTKYYDVEVHRMRLVIDSSFDTICLARVSRVVSSSPPCAGRAVCPTW